MGGWRGSPSTQFIAEGKAEAGDVWEALALMLLWNPFVISAYLLFYMFVARATTA